MRLMYVGGYRHNNKGFCENFTFTKSINRRRTTIIEVPMQAWWNFSFPLSSSRGDECSREDLTIRRLWIPLEDGRLNG